MSEAIGRWLAKGRVGASSTVLAAAALGALPAGEPSYPHDFDDFGRCFRLCQMAPSEAALGLKRLAEVSGKWERLAAKWGELCLLYESDVDACNKLVKSCVARVVART